MPRLTDPSTTYKPFAYPQFMNFAVEHEKIHWVEQELELQEDIRQWNDGTMSDQDKMYVLQIQRLFTQTDAQVASNYCNLFIPVFKNNEVRSMLLAFAAREGIHQRAYALFADTIGMPEDMYSEFLNFEEMREKIEFMQQNDVSTPEGVVLALAQTVCNEGMSLFSSFAMLLNFQRFGKMTGLCTIAEWSLRDETQHIEGMSELFVQYVKENPWLLDDKLKSKIYEMYKRAVALEDAFIEDVFRMGNPEGITKEEMHAYIRFVANRRLRMIGMKDIFDVDENPLPWLDWVTAAGQSNFFEKRVADYSAGALSGKWDHKHDFVQYYLES